MLMTSGKLMWFRICRLPSMAGHKNQEYGIFYLPTGKLMQTFKVLKKSVRLNIFYIDSEGNRIFFEKNAIFLLVFFKVCKLTA